MKAIKSKPNNKYQALLVSKLRDVNNYVQKWRDIYPIIVFAILPSLIFWTSKNIQELTPALMMRVIIFSAIAGSMIYGAAYFYLRDKYKASLLSILIIIVTFSYGQFYEFYKSLTRIAFGDNNGIESHFYFILILLIIFLLISTIIKNRLKYSSTIRNYLALVATVLLVINLYPVIAQQISNPGFGSITVGNSVEAAGPADHKAPDIYYLVFDRYANQKVLEDVYDFDNSTFINSMKDKGFYIAHDSAANYPFTNYSLASSLNLDYLPDSFHKESQGGVFYGLAHDKIENNRVQAFLKERGYVFENIGPWWNPTKYNKNADRDLYNPTGPVILGKSIDLYEHEIILFQDTILWPFFSKLPTTVGRHKVYGLTYPTNEKSTRAIQRQTSLHQFQMLKDSTKRSGPKFVFAHFLLPHEPYIFNEKCKPYSNNNEYQIYIKQLQCTNSYIQQTVDYILKNSKKDPIIVIQSDEGPYPLELRKNKSLAWKKADKSLLHQKGKIINTYYFPDKNYSQLYPGISPVNTFRVIFNQYQGTDMPLLEDKNYFPIKGNKMQNIFDATEALNN